MTYLNRTAFYRTAASLAALLIVGCGGSPKPGEADGNVAAPPPLLEAGGTKQVTLHVPEMADRLKLL